MRGRGQRDVSKRPQPKAVVEVARITKRISTGSMRKKAQVPSDVRPTSSAFVLRMGSPFVYRNLFKIKWTDSFEAGRINPILIGVGPALVMCVYPAL
jgi:hypothetical protein